MGPLSRSAALLAATFAGGSAVAVAPASHQPPGRPDALTPQGPATLRNAWLGYQTLEERGPEVLVGWRVTVGPGGNAGPVRLRVLSSQDRTTVLGSGPVEQLPAAPGTYSFALRPGIPFEYRDADLGLDQEVGGHAIVTRHPFDRSGDDDDPSALNPWALDVFRPRLADGARGVRRGERRQNEEMLLEGVVEGDVDRDRLGDKTQDAGDLRFLGARVAGRRGGGLTIRVGVRNVGATTRHLPQVVTPRRVFGVVCSGPTALRVPEAICAGPALRPGAEAVLTLQLLSRGSALPPARLRVASEGPDANPADNAGPLTPLLRLRLRPAAGGDGPAVRVESTHPGRVRLTVSARGAALMRRTVRLGRAGRRTVRLSRARGGRLTVTAAQGDARATIRVR